MLCPCPFNTFDLSLMVTLTICLLHLKLIDLRHQIFPETRSTYLGVPGLGGEARSQPMPLRPAVAVGVALEAAILLLARRTDFLTRGRAGVAAGDNWLK